MRILVARTGFTLVAALFAGCSGVAAARDSTAAWDAGGKLWLLSDYVWNGVSQSQGDPALQAEVFVGHRSGFYLGAWASTADFTDADDEPDGISFELDPYVGWAGDLAEGLELDLSLTQVRYPGRRQGFDYDYIELQATLGFATHYEASVAYASDIFNLGGAGIYYRLAGDWPLGDDGVSLRAHAGHYDLEDAAGGSYSDWLVGVARHFGAVEAQLQFTDTAGFDDAVGAAVGDARFADGRLSLVLAIEF